MSAVARVKKDPEDRRGDILDATLELIEERGIDQLRGADLAKRLGVSTGLIFYHFDNLQTLVISALRYAAKRDLDDLEAVLAGSEQDVESRLRAVLREYGPTGTAFGWRLWVESWSASLRSPELRAVVRDLDVGWREVIVGLIDEGVAAGAFVCPDPAAAGWRLTALLDGLAVQQVVFDEAVSTRQMEEWTELALERELGLGVAS